MALDADHVVTRVRREANQITLSGESVKTATDFFSSGAGGVWDDLIEEMALYCGQYAVRHTRAQASAELIDGVSPAETADIVPLARFLAGRMRLGQRPCIRETPGGFEFLSRDGTVPDAEYPRFIVADGRADIWGESLNPISAQLGVVKLPLSLADVPVIFEDFCVYGAASEVLAILGATTLAARMMTRADEALLPYALPMASRSGNQTEEERA